MSASDAALEDFGTQEFQRSMMDKITAIEGRLKEMPTKADVDKAIGEALRDEQQQRRADIAQAILSEQATRDSQMTELRQGFQTLTSELRAMLVLSLSNFEKVATRIEGGFDKLSADVHQQGETVAALTQCVEGSEQAAGKLEARVGVTEARAIALFGDLKLMSVQLFGDPTKPDIESLESIVKALPAQIKAETKASAGALALRIDQMAIEMSELSAFINTRRQIESAVLGWAGKMATNRVVHLIVYGGAAMLVAGLVKFMTGG